MTIGRNDSCPCGSKKKYKKCYLANSGNCTLYLKDKNIKMSNEYEEILRSVIERLQRTTWELNQLFYKTEDDKEIIPALMQLVGIFTVIDVLGNYWYEYLGKKASTSKRFDEYLDSFCFTDKNKEFLGRKYLNSITAEKLRLLRNNVVHFNGLGMDSSIAILSNLSKDNTQAQIDLAVNNLLKLNKNIVFIQTLELKRIVIEGSILMFERFQTDGVSASSDEEKLLCIKNIERIRYKLDKEGAMGVSPEMADRVWGIAQ